MKRRLLYIFIAVVSITTVNAQTITGVASTESRCTASGTLTVTVSGGTAPYQYAITAGPVTYPNQSSNVFTALPPGTNYTVRVTDNVGSTATRTASVTGTYAVMAPTQVLTRPFCPGGSDGKIAVTIPANTGRAPYSFQLIAPSPVTTAVITPGSNTYTFTGLAAGSYRYQVSDSCGNIQTRDVIITNPVPGALGFNHNTDLYYRKVVCDSLDLYSSVFGGNAPFQLTVNLNGVSSPATTLVSPKFGTGTVFIMRVPYTAVAGGTHSFTLRDTCGQTFSNAFTTHFAILQPTPTTQGCYPERDFYYGFKGLKAPVTVNVFRGSGTGGSLYTTRTVSTLPSDPGGAYGDFLYAVPAGTYTLQVTDACGITLTSTSNITNKTPKSINVTLEKNASSLDSTTTVSFNANQFLSQPVKFNWLSGTASYSSAKNKYSQTKTYPYLDSFPVQNNVFKFSNVPMGTYRVAVTDSCGWTDTLNFTVGPTNVQTMSFYDSVLLGCINDNKITATLTSGTAPLNGYIYLSRILPGGGSSLVSTATSNTTPLSTVFNSVLSNTSYAVSFIYSIYPKYLFGTGSVARIDTVFVPPYTQPAVTSSTQAIACTGSSTGSITVNTAGGAGTYTYEIISGTATAPAQASPVFTGLPAPGTYTVRAVDGCGNSNTYSVSMANLAPPNITADKICATMGQSMVLTADSIYGATYSWSGPAGYAATGRSITLPAMTPAQTGDYIVTLSLPGCSDVTKKYTVTNCVVVPVTLRSFEAAINNCRITLKWTAAIEQQFRQYVVEYSKDGSNYAQAGIVQPLGDNATYTFTHQPSEGKAFYRLAMIDLNGSKRYSNIRYVNMNCNGETNITVYPNPVADKAVITGLPSAAVISLFTVLGQKLVAAVTASTTYELDMSAYPAGTYLLQVTRKDNTVQSLKLIKR